MAEQQDKFTKFQSTRPVRDATSLVAICHRWLPVSIHAPRAGRDRLLCSGSLKAFSFNPRAPCGTRHQRPGADLMLSDVSIHAPRAGRDCVRGVLQAHSCCFNPRAPCGTRPNCVPYHAIFSPFQSTRPVRDATDNLRLKQ